MGKKLFGALLVAGASVGLVFALNKSPDSESSDFGNGGQSLPIMDRGSDTPQTVIIEASKFPSNDSFLDSPVQIPKSFKKSDRSRKSKPINSPSFVFDSIANAKIKANGSFKKESKAPVLDSPISVRVRRMGLRGKPYSKRVAIPKGVPKSKKVIIPFTPVKIKNPMSSPYGSVL